MGTEEKVKQQQSPQGKGRFGIKPFRWVIVGDYSGYWTINKPQRQRITIRHIRLLIQVRGKGGLQNDDKVEFVINGTILNVFTTKFDVCSVDQEVIQ